MTQDSKRQKLPIFILHSVATPIGNMGDLSPRAKEVLTRVRTIFAEDTRRARQLLESIGSKARALRLDAHASESEISKAIHILREEGEGAVITDAGTPGIQDPGSALARACLSEDIRVSPVPGPSALAAFLSVAGFRWGEVEFRGYFPRDGQENEWKHVEHVASQSKGCRVFVWFESPRRIMDTIASGEKTLPESRWVVAKELTKIHEWVAAGRPREIKELLESSPDPDVAETGEWVFGIELNRLEKPVTDDWVKTLQCLLECGVSPSDAAKKISQCFGVSRKIIYSRAIEFKDGKKFF